MKSHIHNSCVFFLKNPIHILPPNNFNKRKRTINYFTKKKSEEHLTLQVSQRIIFPKKTFFNVRARFSFLSVLFFVFMNFSNSTFFSIIHGSLKMKSNTQQFLCFFENPQPRSIIKKNKSKKKDTRNKFDTTKFTQKK